MSCENYLVLNNVTHISKELESQNILHGTIDFFNWATLEIGNYQNISISPATSGIYGGQKFRLRPVVDPRFDNNRVWEGFKGNWVWESGSSFSTAPINISGVYVDGAFHTKDSSTYPHYVDYKRGRVVFTSGITSTSVVTAEYSPRIVQFIDSASPYFKQLLYSSYRVDDSDYLSSQSGAWNRLSDLREELPLVAVNVSPNTTLKPYQIGGGQLAVVDVEFYIFAEDKFWRDQICDIVARQNNKAFWLPNRGTMKASADYPFDLDYRGALVDSPTEYPDIVAPTGDGGYRWRQMYFTKTTKQFRDHRSDLLFEGIVKATAEIRI